MSAPARAASPSSTSTARTPVRSVNDPSGAARSSRPASMATRKSQTRSISPSRWLATMTAIPNSVPVRRTSAEHLVAAGRVEAVGRLVEQQQPRVVDERLGELDPLLHAGRIAADRAVALLVQPDVAEDLGGPLAGGRARQARHPRHVGDEVGGRGVGRQAVVLGHVADELADRRALGAHVEAHDRRVARRRLEEPEQDLDERALAGAVGADEADDPGLELEGQAVERDDAARVALGQAGEGDETHGPAKGTRRRQPRCGRPAIRSRSRGRVSAEPEAVDDRRRRGQDGLQVRAVGGLDRDDERSVLAVNDDDPRGPVGLEVVGLVGGGEEGQTRRAGQRQVDDRRPTLVDASRRRLPGGHAVGRDECLDEAAGRPRCLRCACRPTDRPRSARWRRSARPCPARGR